MRFWSHIHGGLSLLQSLSFIWLMVFMASCNVHEFPDEFRRNIENEQKTVSVQLSVSLNMLASYVHDTVYITRALNDSCQRRFFIEVFNDSLYDNSRVDSIVVLQNLTDTTHLSTTLKLEPKKYKIAIWQDYVLNDSINPYYQAPSTKAIHLPGPESYIGDTEDKLCSASCIDVDLRPYVGQQDVNLVIKDTLKCPLARIEFVTTDVNKFISRLSRESKSADDDLFIESYTAKIVYTAYLPSGFNVVTNKTNDSSLGYSCETRLVQISPTEARVGFDYVLINSHESFVDAQLVIYDGKGVEVTHSDPIQIPIKRGGTTYILDEFLTKEANSGVRINPTFYGEFNIFI